MITGKVVPYCLLNYNKKQYNPLWVYDTGPWDDMDVPRYHKTKFLTRIDLDQAVDIYTKLLNGNKIYVNQLIDIRKKPKDRFRLSLHVTENFPEIGLKNNGGLYIDFAIKKKRERDCFKKGFVYTPWSRQDEL